MTMVFDASVVTKVLTEEPLSATATSTMAREADRIAPDILTLEVASALSKKARYGGLAREQIDRALAALPELITEQTPSSTLVGPAVTLSIELKHAVYDCLYLALAEQRDCFVVTADEKYAAIVEASRLAHRLRRLSQVPQCAGR